MNNFENNEIDIMKTDSYENFINQENNENEIQ